MSSPRLAIPDSPQQRNQLQAESERQRQQQGTSNIQQQQAITNLAYQLWQQRGCPVGSPEDDWIRAEALVLAGKTQSALGSL
jgi:hypothetical protein